MLGKHAVKTYVQPAWMPADEAQAVARSGQLPARRAGASTAVQLSEDTVTNEDAARLTRDNDELRAENARLKADNDEVRRRLTRLEGSNDAERANAKRSAPSDPTFLPPPAASSANGNGHVDDALYQAIKTRLLSDLPNEPALLRVLTERPALEVQRKRRTIEVDGDTLKGRLAGLIVEGFFDQPKKGYGAFVELQRLGAKVAKPGVYNMCDQLAKDGFLTKEGDGYRVVGGMKVNIVDVP